MIVGLLASLPPPPVPPPSTTFPILLLEPEDFRGVPALRLTWRTAGDPKESDLLSAHLYKALYKEPAAAASGALVANIVSTDM